MMLTPDSVSDSMTPQEFIECEILSHIEAFTATSVGRIVCSVEDPVAKWGLAPGDWLGLVRAGFDHLASRNRIEPVSFGSAIFYQFPNVLQRMANAVEDSYDDG